MAGSNFLDNYDNFFIDLDGVMWNGQIAIEGSAQAIQFLLSNNKKVFFITNNSLWAREDIQKRLFSMGIIFPIENIYTSSFVTLRHLKAEFPNALKVVVLGMSALRAYLKDEGYQVIYPSELENPISDIQSLQKFEVEPEIQVVVISFDINFDYFGALYCAACIQNGAKVLGLHMERSFISGKNIIPTAGCNIKFIETATGVKADIIGKPYRIIFDMIAQEHVIDPKRTLMIGDTMDSDILFGINSGIDTALVLSGVTNLDDLEKYSYQPNYVLETLGKLIE